MVLYTSTPHCPSSMIFFSIFFSDNASLCVVYDLKPIKNSIIEIPIVFEGLPSLLRSLTALSTITTVKMQVFVEIITSKFNDRTWIVFTHSLA